MKSFEGGQCVEFKFGILTNMAFDLDSVSHSEPQASPNLKNLKFRGDLVVSFLSEENTEKCFEVLVAEKDHYPGFNVLLAKSSRLFYFTNLAEHQGKKVSDCLIGKLEKKPNGKLERVREVVELNPGFYGLSNTFLDVEWSKVKCGKQQFKEIVQSFLSSYQQLSNSARDSENKSPKENKYISLLDDLLDLMSRSDTFESNEDTYKPPHKNLASVFVKETDLDSTKYATRYQCAFIVRTDGKVFFKEKNFNLDLKVNSARRWETRLYEFSSTIK